MFENEELKKHLETSLSIQAEPVAIAEWNMNVPGNIQKLGNYRYRINDTRFNILPSVFDMLDTNNFYTGATDSDITVDYGFKEDGSTPLLFTYKKDKEKLYYSLEDCTKPFRPRSGINKLSYFNNKYIPNFNENSYLRPRYYMPTKDDEFKYWRSYRTESDAQITNSINVEYGISKNSSGQVYFIEDCNPFVAYKEKVPANRLIVKLQTNIGTIDLGSTFKNSAGVSMQDPFYGQAKATVPQNFKVQYLDSNNQWITAKEFNSSSVREDLVSPIFGPDGYLSLEYGIEVPLLYKNNFVLIDTIISEKFLPDNNRVGAAYIVAANERAKGVLYIWNGQEYEEYPPVYDWFIGTDGTYENTHFVTDFTNPSYYNETGEGENTYREFVWMKGVRLVVETMQNPNTVLELIELSPRLVADLSKNLIDFNITKSLSDLSSSALPVGSIQAGVGDMTLFDPDHTFNPLNAWNDVTKEGSIIAKYSEKNIKFVFYEVIKNVNNSNYYVPIKTMYTESFPERSPETGEVRLKLRDFYFYLESTKAPRILLTDVSLSQAVCILLDSIGFSNYSFKRMPDQKDPIIPYFFIAPDQNVAEVLSQLARATQSAMFFDEYNNFVVYTKEYLLDDTGYRTSSFNLYGENKDNKLANIISVGSVDKKIYNSGSINFTSRYIQKTAGSIEQRRFVDRSYIYNPSLLWEASGTEKTMSVNGGNTAKYTLAAVPLNTTLRSSVPTVSERRLINNTFSLGENAYFLTRFKGFLYANGEIIKYDAVEFNVSGTGNVWISSNLEYQKYFASIPFNGKIYPTGNVRIYAEPFYENLSGIKKLKNGDVVSHGRGQFGTPILEHSAGLPSYWSDNNNVRGCDMRSDYLYNTDLIQNPIVTDTTNGIAGVNNAIATKSQRNGIIRNFLSTGYLTETNVGSLSTTTTGTIQSSALVMTGPDFEPGANARDFVSYIHKPLDGAYKHFGTRVRIIGKIEANNDRSQTVVGGMKYYYKENSDPTQNISIGGGSAGVSIVNPNTNNGYFFELAALTTSSVESFLDRDENNNATVSIENIQFYKVKRSSTATSNSDKAIPVRLWGGVGNILVDDGNFAGQYRFFGEENPTVYDLAIEYVDVNASRRDFYLYINQKLIARVTDNDPLPLVNTSVALFVRGNAKAMFENIYALSKNYATNTVFDVNTPISSIFGAKDDLINASEALTKYSMSGMIQSTYLSGIRPNNSPDYAMYFEEFGTIMRECSYFNIKYDRSYPALYAKIAPTLNKLKGYTVSGFTADSYGAEFLVFNNTDTLLSLDASDGNYLRIIGVSFTQDATNTITVDDFLKRKGNLADPELKGDTLIYSPQKYVEQYEKIKQSVLLYGKNDFTLESPYIQTQDVAEDLLGWIIEKNIRPRKLVGASIYSIPTVQLGDIVNIKYKNSEGIDMVSDETTKYVVYNVAYGRSSEGPSMSLYLSEV